MPLPPLFANIPLPFAAFYAAETPWALLGDPLDRILALPAQSDGTVSFQAHLTGDGIVISEGARIHPTAVIDGPVFIGRDAIVMPGAHVRGGCWIGDHAVVGTNTELKRSILFPYAKASHLNYVGDSILGTSASLGAGCVLSNHRHDRANVFLDKTDTGRRKLGAILGDNVLTGCNSVCHPGVVVGRDTHVYPGVQLRRGIYPASSIIKLHQQLDIVART